MMWKWTLQTLIQFNSVIFFFPLRGQKMHNNNKDMSTPKGKEKIIQLKEHGYWAISGHSAKTETEVETWRTKQDKNGYWKDKSKKDHKKQDQKGQFDDKKWDHSDQVDKNHKDWNTRTVKEAFIQLLLKETRESRWNLVNLKKPASKIMFTYYHQPVFKCIDTQSTVSGLYLRLF